MYSEIVVVATVSPSPGAMHARVHVTASRSHEARTRGKSASERNRATGVSEAVTATVARSETI